MMLYDQAREIIDAERQRRGQSIRELSRRAGVSNTTLAAWLRGERDSLADDSLLAVCRVLGTGVEVRKTRMKKVEKSVESS